MSRQKFGVNAIGKHVARDFGEDGIFTGTITRFTRGKNGVEDLYQVTYTDGDVEDMDVPEYNFGYALHLQNEGWEVESARSVSSDDSTNDADKTQTYRPSKVHANTTLHFRQFTPPCSNLFFSSLTRPFLSIFVYNCSQNVFSTLRNRRQATNVLQQKKKDLNHP